MNNLLCAADYKGFWSTLDSDDLYADLIADVTGFEELMRVRIAVTVGQSCRQVDRKVLEGWLNIEGEKFERFVKDVCGWGVDQTLGVKGMVMIPLNKENEAKGTVVRENVQFDRKPSLNPLMTVGMADVLKTEFSRVIRRAYEQPA